MPQSLKGDEFCATNMHFFNPNNVPGQAPETGRFFNFGCLFFQPRHLSPPYWVEILPAGVNFFSPPSPLPQVAFAVAPRAV